MTPRDCLAMSDPAKAAQHQALVPLFSKHMRLVRFWGRIREEGAYMGLKPGHALQMSHAKPTTRVLPNTLPVFTLKHRAHAYTLHSSASPQTSPRRAGEGHTALRKRKLSATPACPWASPGDISSFNCAPSLFPWKPPKTAMPITHPSRAWRCPWNRHN